MPRARLRADQFRDRDVLGEDEHDSWIHKNLVVSGTLTVSGTSGDIELTTNGTQLLVDGVAVGSSNTSVSTNNLTVSETLNVAQGGADWLSGFGNRIAFTIDSSKVDDDLTNFPITLFINTSAGTNNLDLSEIFDELVFTGDDFTITDGTNADSNLWQASGTQDRMTASDGNLYANVSVSDTVQTENSKFRLVGDFSCELYFSDLVTSIDDGASSLKLLIGDGQGSNDHAAIVMATHHPTRGADWQVNVKNTSWVEEAWTNRTNDYGGLRITRTGSTWYFYYKDGDGAWTQLHSEVINTDDLYIYIQASAGTSEAISATISQFIINSADDIIFDDINPNSRKIAVTAADGVTQYYVEIERWDEVDEIAVIHTKIPSISSGSDTTFYLYYDADVVYNDTYVGSTGTTAAQQVWDSDFYAVYHLSTSTPVDSTSNSRDPNVYNIDSGNIENLIKGKQGIHFNDGVSNEYLQTPFTDTAFIDGDNTIESIAKFIEDDLIPLADSSVTGSTWPTLRLYASNTGRKLQGQMYYGGGNAVRVYEDNLTVGANDVAYLSLGHLQSSQIFDGVFGVNGSVEVDDTPTASPGSNLPNENGDYFRCARLKSDGSNEYPDVVVGELRFSNYRNIAWRTTTFYTLTDDLITWGTTSSGSDQDTITYFSVNSDGLALQYGTRINEFSTDTTLSGNSDLAVPTEKTVKTYVDNQGFLDGPAGSDNEVQFNDLGSLAASENFTFDGNKIAVGSDDSSRVHLGNNNIGVPNGNLYLNAGSGSYQAGRAYILLVNGGELTVSAGQSLIPGGDGPDLNINGGNSNETGDLGGDIVLTGGTGNIADGNIVLESNILFGTNTISGTGDIYCNDLHTSGNSVILGTANAKIGGSVGGAVELYHSGTKVAQTGADYLEVLGHFHMGDAKRIRLGNSYDFAIYHEAGYNVIIGGSDTIDTSIQYWNGASSEYLARFVPNGSVELYYDNTLRFYTYNGGCSVNGDLTFPNNRFIYGRNYEDTNWVAMWGVDTSNQIKVGGTLNINGNSVVNVHNIFSTAGIGLWHGGQHVLDTVANGINIQSNGAAEIAQLIFAVGTGNFYISNTYHGGSLILRGEDSSGNTKPMFYADPDGEVNLYSSGNVRFSTTALGCRLTLDTYTGVIWFDSGILKITNQVHGGPISLQSEDNSGVSKTLFYADPDGSASLYLTGEKRIETHNTGIYFYGPDSEQGRLIFSSNVMSLYSASHGDSVSIRGEDSDGVVRNLFYGDPDGSAHIYYNGTSVAHTDTYGLDVGSSWSSSHLIMGAYHLWVDSTGDLRIKNGAPSSDTDGTVVGSQS